MNDVNTRRLLHEFRQALGHRPIDRVRALTSAEHEQSGPFVLQGFSGDVKESLADGNAGDLGTAKIFRRLFEVHGRRRNPARNHTIGKARDNVGLKG